MTTEVRVRERLGHSCLVVVRTGVRGGKTAPVRKLNIDAAPTVVGA